MGLMEVWDIAGSEPVAIMDLKGHCQIVSSIIVSESLNSVLSGSRDRSVRLWDLRTGQCVRVVEGHNNDVLSVSMQDSRQWVS